MMRRKHLPGCGCPCCASPVDLAAALTLAMTDDPSNWHGFGGGGTLHRVPDLDAYVPMTGFGFDPVGWIGDVCKSVFNGGALNVPRAARLLVALRTGPLPALIDKACGDWYAGWYYGPACGYPYDCCALLDAAPTCLGCFQSYRICGTTTPFLMGEGGCLPAFVSPYALAVAE